MLFKQFTEVYLFINTFFLVDQQRAPVVGTNKTGNTLREM